MTYLLDVTLGSHGIYKSLEKRLFTWKFYRLTKFLDLDKFSPVV